MRALPWLMICAALSGCMRFGFRAAVEGDTSINRGDAGQVDLTGDDAAPAGCDGATCSLSFGVVDPALDWTTFLGGPGTEYGKSVVLDQDGNVYTCGQSNVAWGNPVRAFSDGNWDAFVAKLSPSGDLLWHTFLGSLDWGGDRCFGIALRGDGSVYVVGFGDRDWGTPLRPYSNSNDAFVARLNANGDLLWTTFLGGSGEDTAQAIALDATGVYVAGNSDASWIAPTTASAYSGGDDVFIAKLQLDGTLIWNAFFGSASGRDQYSGTRLVIDDAGDVYAVGLSSASWGAPVRAFSGALDAFAAKVGSNGALLWNTFVGGSGTDEGRGIALAGNGRVLIAGYSGASWGDPLRPLAGGSSDAFVAELGADGALRWNTFLGGGAADIADALQPDAAGNVYVTGHSRAPWGSPRSPYLGGLSDGFVARLDGNGGLVWHLFIGSSGGSGVDDDYGQAIAIDSPGNLYVGGDSDASWGSAVRPFTSGSHDAFVARIGSAP